MPLYRGKLSPTGAISDDQNLAWVKPSPQPFGCLRGSGVLRFESAGPEFSLCVLWRLACQQVRCDAAKSALLRQSAFRQNRK